MAAHIEKTKDFFSETPPKATSELQADAADGDTIVVEHPLQTTDRVPPSSSPSKVKPKDVRRALVRPMIQTQKGHAPLKSQQSRSTSSKKYFQESPTTDGSPRSNCSNGRTFFRR